MSIVFSWNLYDIDSLLASCEKDEVLPLILKHFPKGSKVLESGCGLGRFVKYLEDRGLEMTGLEFSHESCQMVSSKWPELNIVQGDAADSPFPEKSFDGAISLGVVEHWTEGPEKPLKDLFRILRCGGLAIITVPCFNRVRKLKRMLWWEELRNILQFFLIAVIRRKSLKSLKLNKLQSTFKYVVYPSIGPFYEYRMSPDEFAAEIRKAGFEIIEHLPLDHMDGLYHELNPFKLLVKFRNWDFTASQIGIDLNQALKKTPFLHCHMQVVVARKPYNNCPAPIKI